MITVTKFEETIAEFYGSKYAVATDCCTHAIELCLRYTEEKFVTSQKHTYLSVPMTFMKLNLRWAWHDTYWKDYYYLGNTNIIDAAVYWKRDSYIRDSFMCLSFQHKKHLNVGRGGMILTDDYTAYTQLKKMSYDGRLPDVAWAEQDVDTLGYHYYMTPETAQMGLDRFLTVKDSEPRQWSYKDYPDLSTMKVFNVK